MNETESGLGFAPDDPTDGRKQGDWKTRYPDKECQLNIRKEAIYIGVLLFLTPILMLILWMRFPTYWFIIDEYHYEIILRYSIAWLGGTLGGTLFDIKWLYHSVARNLWNVDRRLWRLFTPHISGALAFAIILLISSGILKIFDKETIHSPSVILSIGFLVGYFSDSATAKLSELAETLFGTLKKSK